jgi:hypothetical protein
MPGRIQKSLQVRRQPPDIPSARRFNATGQLGVGDPAYPFFEAHSPGVPWRCGESLRLLATQRHPCSTSSTPFDQNKRAHGMNTNTLSRISSLRHPRPADMSIAWEFLPSLQHLIDTKEHTPRDHPIWADTMPCAFDAMETSEQFSEPMEGLSVREMNEPEIFKAYFG